VREILARPVIFGDVVLKLAELVEEGMLVGPLIDPRRLLSAHSRSMPRTWTIKAFSVSSTLATDCLLLALLPADNSVLRE
jgi:hypothetical protein